MSFDKTRGCKKIIKNIAGLSAAQNIQLGEKNEEDSYCGGGVPNHSKLYLR